jgi:hypothetical protein
MENLVLFVIIAAFAGIGGMIKTRQERKAREEAARRNLERRASTAPPPPAPVSYAEEDRDEPEEPEEREAPEPPEEREAPKASGSPLEEFRRFVREAQEAERRRHSPPLAPVPRPAPRTVAVSPAPVPVVKETRSFGAVLDAKAVTVDAARTARFAQQQSPVTVPLAPLAGAVAAHESSAVEAVLASDRSDLAKAVLVSEVLGPPRVRKPYGPAYARR